VMRERGTHEIESEELITCVAVADLSEFASNVALHAVCQHNRMFNFCRLKES